MCGIKQRLLVVVQRQNTSFDIDGEAGKNLALLSGSNIDPKTVEACRFEVISEGSKSSGILYLISNPLYHHLQLPTIYVDDHRQLYVNRMSISVVKTEYVP